MPFYSVENKQTASPAVCQPSLLMVGWDDGNLMKFPRVMHKHDSCLEIVLIRSGTGRHIIEGRVFDTKKGDLLIYNAGVLHDERSSLEDGMGVYYCSATNVQFPGLPPNHLMADSTEAVISLGDSCKRIEALFELMCQTASESRPEGVPSDRRMDYSSEACHSLLRALLMIIYGRIRDEVPAVPVSEPELNIQIKNYLDQHFQEDLSLEDISDVFHINLYYLAHLFKEMTGYSPMQYLIRRRIGEAQSLLQNTDWTVANIATHVGYNNINHFHSAFGRLVGMSPGKYRQNWKKS